MSFDHLHDKPYFMPSCSQADAGAHDARSALTADSLTQRPQIRTLFVTVARRHICCSFVVDSRVRLRVYWPDCPAAHRHCVAQLPGAVAENRQRRNRSRANSVFSSWRSECGLLVGRRLGSLCNGRCVVERCEAQSSADASQVQFQVQCDGLTLCWFDIVIHRSDGSGEMTPDLSQFAWFDATATRASANELLRYGTIALVVCGCFVNVR